MRKIRIQNDGQPAHMTKVTDAETGENIDYVMRIDLVIDANEDEFRRSMPYVIMHVGWLPIVDVIVDAEIRKVCPVCGKPKED